MDYLVEKFLRLLCNPLVHFFRVVILMQPPAILRNCTKEKSEYTGSFQSWGPFLVYPE